MKSSPIQNKFPLKPECTYGEVIATDRGWEVVQPNGSKEILVSCLNLKSMIDADAGLEPEAPSIPEVPPVIVPPPAYSESELAEQREKEEQRLASEKAAQDALLNPPEGGTGGEGGEGTQGNESGPGEGSGVTGEGSTSTEGDTTKVDESVALYTKDALMALKMDEVRAIGKTFKVADTSKENLVDKIIVAQAEAEAAKTT